MAKGLEMKKRKDDFRIIELSDIKITKREIRGEQYINILKHVEKIVFHQQNYKISDGIKGFIFHGDVGTGKTTIAKALAHSLRSTLIFIDGSDIARPRYGESENQIKEVFDLAESSNNSIVLIDDCESVFPTRDWIKGESWHIAQNNVFFHVLDNLDSSKACVILTTNRYDLLDRAVKDRLYNILFPNPDKEALRSIAEQKMKKLRLHNTDKIYEAIGTDKFQTMRELEKFITEEYINEIIKT